MKGFWPLIWRGLPLADFPPTGEVLGRDKPNYHVPNVTRRDLGKRSFLGDAPRQREQLVRVLGKHSGEETASHRFHNADGSLNFCLAQSDPASENCPGVIRFLNIIVVDHSHLVG